MMIFVSNLPVPTLPEHNENIYVTVDHTMHVTIHHNPTSWSSDYV